jgi:hypothetical protein
MSVPDYVQIQENLVALIQTVDGFRQVFMEGSEAEVGNLSHMPVCNVRMTEAHDQLVRIPNGYDEQLTVLVDILTFDFTSYSAAARLRSDLLRAVREKLLENPHFDPQILTSQLSGGVSFGAFTAEGNRGHVAMATLTVICEIDVEV